MKTYIRYIDWKGNRYFLTSQNIKVKEDEVSVITIELFFHDNVIAGALDTPFYDEKEEDRLDFVEEYYDDDYLDRIDKVREKFYEGKYSQSNFFIHTDFQ